MNQRNLNVYVRARLYVIYLLLVFFFFFYFVFSWLDSNAVWRSDVRVTDAAGEQACDAHDRKMGKKKAHTHTHTHTVCVYFIRIVQQMRARAPEKTHSQTICHRNINEFIKPPRSIKRSSERLRDVAITHIEYRMQVCNWTAVIQYQFRLCMHLILDGGDVNESGKKSTARCYRVSSYK